MNVMIMAMADMVWIRGRFDDVIRVVRRISLIRFVMIRFTAFFSYGMVLLGNFD